MQYLWQHKLQLRPGMKTVDGRSLQIIDPGRLNTDSGPDFFNAKIKINGELWIGNIEIHVRATDWYRHGHDTDPAYDSVILHVVGLHDRNIIIRDGRMLPQLELPCNPAFTARYNNLVSLSRTDTLPCKSTIDSLPSIYISDWIGALGFERLHMKVDRIISQLHTLAGDWEETAYITLARALGFNTNSEPFERLARSTPLRYIRKHADDIMAIESMLLGQAGLLEEIPANNPYARRLADEYRFMVNKFMLRNPGIQWKMSRMRPANLPYRRIALLARIVTRVPSLMSEILAINTTEEAMSLFNRQLDGYWQYNYTFTSTPDRQTSVPVALSRTSVISLIINVVAPLTYAWGQIHGDFKATDRATNLLQEAPAEHNRLTLPFENAGVKIENALESQALIQARKSYCDAGKCLFCRIGHKMLSSQTS